MSGQIKRTGVAQTATQPQAAVAATGAVVGAAVDLDDVASAAVQYPTLRANSPYHLAVHPQRWCVREGYVVPDFAPIVRQAGIDGNTEASLREAAGRAQDRGWTVIPTSAGPGGRSYLSGVVVSDARDAAGKPVHVAHLTVFDRAYMGTDAVRCDRKALSEWVWDLVDRRVIPPPSVVGLERLRSSLESRALKLAGLSLASPAAKAKQTEAERDLAAVDAVLNRLRAPVVPAVGAAVEID